MIYKAKKTQGGKSKAYYQVEDGNAGRFSFQHSGKGETMMTTKRATIAKSWGLIKNGQVEHGRPSQQWDHSA